MSATFEAEKNRKAFIYTAIICITLLLLFILISWKVMPPPVPVIQDLIEINLGNNDEGFGDIQPMKRGNRTLSQENASVPKQTASKAIEAEKIMPDENAEENAAAVVKPEKLIAKKTAKEPLPEVKSPPKPQNPKITYDGPDKGRQGNNPSEDNSYTYQGNKPGAKADNGQPTGNKDSYGDTPGGKTGGPRVIRGNRKIIRAYSFTGELPKAIIYAIIKVNAAGNGIFTGFDKGSTSRSQSYAQAIGTYLQNMQFDKSSEESNVTVQFTFNIN